MIICMNIHCRGFSFLNPKYNDEDCSLSSPRIFPHSFPSHWNTRVNLIKKRRNSCRDGTFLMTMIITIRIYQTEFYCYILDYGNDLRYAPIPPLYKMFYIKRTVYNFWSQDFHSWIKQEILAPV